MESFCDHPMVENRINNKRPKVKCFRSFVSTFINNVSALKSYFFEFISSLENANNFASSNRFAINCIPKGKPLE